MPFTGRIGSVLSEPGNVVLAHQTSRQRIFRQPARSPLYRVQVLDLADNTTFDIGPLIAEFDRFKNLAYADYANSVPEAFFTLHQDDPKIVSLRDKGGRAHVRNWRNDELVRTGCV